MKPANLDIIDDDKHESLPIEGFVCPICEEELGSGELFQKHMLKHEGEQPSFECEFCKKIYPDAATFGKHLYQHTVEKPFKCEVCGKSFREKCSLTRHAHTHTGVKPFRCEICFKHFSDKGSYGRHKKSHMGESAKVHKCPFHPCDRSFIDKSSLNRHCKVHTGEKPFVCKVCSKCFTESGSYKRHERVHTGEKRYACRVCHRAFSERTSMLRHERNVCKLDSRKEKSDTTHLPSQSWESSRPYSIADFYSSFLGKPSDVLNNNIQTPFEGEDDVGALSHSTHGAELPAANGNKDNSGNSQQEDDSLYAALRRKDKGGTMHDRGGNFNAAGCYASARQESQDVRQWPAMEKGAGSDREVTPEESSEELSVWFLSQNGAASSSDRIRNVAPKMLELHHLLEKKRPESRNKEHDTQMCFECGDIISDDDDEDESQSTSDSLSTMSDSNRRRCRTCRQETVSFGTEESLPSFADSNTLPRSPSSSVTENYQVQKTESLEREVDETARFLLSLINSVSQSQPSGSSRAESITPRHKQPAKRNLACPTCGKTFCDSSKMKRHYRIHLNMRDFVCRVCHKGFIEASSLRRHESVHSDVKPHNCSACGKGYTDSSGLKKHLLRCQAHASKVKAEDAPVKDSSSQASEGATARVQSPGHPTPEPTPGGTFSKGSSNTSDESESSSSMSQGFLRGLKGGAISVDMKEAVYCPVCSTLFVSAHFLKEHIRKMHKEFEYLLNSSLSPEVMEAAATLSVMNMCGGSQLFTSSLSQPEDASRSSVVAFNTASGCKEGLGSSEPSSAGSVHSSNIPNHKGGGDASCKPILAAAVSTLSVTDTSLESAQLSHNTVAAETSSLSSYQDSMMSENDTSTHTEFIPPALTSSSALKRSCSVEAASPAIRPLEAASLTMGSADVSTPVVPGTPVGAQSHSPCHVCGKEFADASSLKRHSRLHNDQQHKCACQNCHKLFSDQGSLKRHLLRGCRNTAKVFRDGESSPGGGMGTGVAEGEGERFACTQCQMVFGTREDQMRHEKEHRVTPSLRCTVCRKSFSDHAVLQRHLLVHASQRPYSCDVCCKGFADSGSLSKHRGRGCYAHSSVTLDPSKLHCADCGKVFSDQANFLQHQACHRDGAAKLKPYPCHHCGKSFADAGSLKRHTRLHTGQNLCRCLHCGRTFLENSGLKKHLQRRSCLQERKKVTRSWLYPCPQCEKVFTKRYILLRHMKTHLGLRPFACDKCDKTFTESSSLKRHYRQHTGERPYWCGWCHKAFADAGVLKKHKQRCRPLHYTGQGQEDQGSASPSQPQPPYLFNGSSFGRKFARHLKNMASQSFHGGRPSTADSPGRNSTRIGSLSRPFLHSKDCWRCGRCFPSPEARERHVKAVHAGTWASFSCRLCWRRFSRLPYLRVHEKQQHRSSRVQQKKN